MLAFKMANISRPKTRQVTCPHCGGNNVNLAVVQAAFAHCDDCGYSKSQAAVEYSGEGANLIGGLVALGVLAVGAVLVGALLDSLDSNKKKVSLPQYDEENWQRVFK